MEERGYLINLIKFIEAIKFVRCFLFERLLYIYRERKKKLAGSSEYFYCFSPFFFYIVFEIIVSVIL